ncbi:hypothetical protein FH608_046680 [Nonomuraea phyllanthi]|uniref:Uncharacterized protein n=1 Tax=Nonomuraea phyllanthi TaxID=2219224 RepID=A0A5C4V6A9_9ACTN|nr:hypothetical protein [Nonomuraea phyllanthi]KAB8186975.1 hypothetical protein FH608_046680 [Nonomuraea phyllanthi]
MADRPDFGVLLTRLLDYRQTDIAWLASVSGIPESELRSVSDGAPPSPSQLHDLAGALGFHAADLFVIADLPVPETLTPCEPAAGSTLSRLVRVTMALPEDQRTYLHETVERLPQLPRVCPADPPRTYYQGDGGFGEMLVTMLCINRNLHSPVAAAKILALLTQGRVYLSPSTLHSIAAGRAPLNPIWLAGFATTLGIPAGDLAAVTRVDLSEAVLSHDPLAAEMATLLWGCRRLTAHQIERVCTEAEAMLLAVPDNASSDDWNFVHHQGGTWWGAPRR